ncbi:MAG: hypothetical protein K6G40_01935 [Eubacterium sp.]|nr:hypothetical protein [Eubacterium sp.]
MVSEEKTAIMTKLSAFEQEHEREIEMKTKYKRRDYVSVKMFQAFLMSSIAYVLAAAAIVYFKSEVGSVAFRLDNAAVAVFGCYFIFVPIMLMIVFIYARKRYDAIAKVVAVYQDELKKLEKLYTEEGVKQDAGNIGS